MSTHDKVRWRPQVLPLHPWITFRANTCSWSDLTHCSGDKMVAIFQTTFWNGFSRMKMSLKFVPGGPMNNIPALVQIMARCGPGDKPLSETMMFRLLTHICVTRVTFLSKRGHAVRLLLTPGSQCVRYSRLNTCSYIQPIFFNIISYIMFRAFQLMTIMDSSLIPHVCIYLLYAGQYTIGPLFTHCIRFGTMVIYNGPSCLMWWTYLILRGLFS